MSKIRIPKLSTKDKVLNGQKTKTKKQSVMSYKLTLLKWYKFSYRIKINTLV